MGNVNIESFAETIRSNVMQRLGKDYQVEIQKVNKNNGVPYIGLNLRKHGQTVTPVVYLNEHFQQYISGRATIQQIADRVAKTVRAESPYIDVRQFLNYESVRKMVVYRVINTERNKELLEDLPHVEYMDLSIIFKVLISQEDLSTASILVHNVHIKLWGVTVEDLYRDAQENTQRLDGYELKSMARVLYEMMEAEDQAGYNPNECMKSLSDDVSMYVLSNKHKIEGTSCMLYPDVIRNFSDMIGSSLYIIPSSIHELLLLPAADTKDSGEIRNMIREVNDTQVEPEEILSYSLYYYNREEDRIIIL